MTILITVLVLLAVSLFLAYFEFGLYVSIVTFAIALGGTTAAWGWTGFNCVLWGLLALTTVVLVIPPLRMAIVTAPALAFFRGTLPPISQTEKEALEAGSVFWEGELFSGNPDWEKLHQIPKPELTAEEQAYLDGPVAKLCEMVDEWEVTDKLHDLPKEAWAYIKKEKFFGLIIPKEYGGLGFSALANSAVVMKLSSRSITLAVTVMVPNSLGPAELLLHYGTKEQKDRYLPGLATGSEIPCFALTEPLAGSDAGGIQATGVVEKGMFQGKEVVGIRLNFDKRYITLSPEATVMGLAFKMYDPNGLVGGKKDIGITVALIPSNLPGVEIGRRHEPLSSPFLNGPIHGKNVFIPADFIVGGLPYAGKGWQMLMERLGIGRGISLPALGTAAGKVSSRAVGGYSRIRRQFRLPVGRFEGVEEALGFIAGNAYAMDAMRTFTVGAIMRGESPSLASAMAKYNITERMRQVVNQAMDVQGGGAIVLGPRNFLGRCYQNVPIAITVEGANILTRTLIVFGQGIIRAHPWVYKEMEASANNKKDDFDRAFFGHVGFSLSVGARSLVSALTGGLFLSAPSGAGELAPYYRHISRLSSAFAIVGDIAMLALGGKLKRLEKLAGRMADAISNLYIASAVLKRFADEGGPKEDLPLARWALDDSLFKVQEALDGFLKNMPTRPAAMLLRLFVFPCGKPFNPPSDRRGADAARLIMEEGPSRDRLTAGIYVGTDITQPLARIDDALKKVLAAEPVEKKMASAAKEGKITSHGPAEMLEEAARNGVITPVEKAIVVAAEKARYDVVTVDDFPKDYWENRHG